MITSVDVERFHSHPFTDSERARVEALIPLAEARLAARVPTLAARLAEGSVDRILYVGTIAEVVLRVIRNPDGVQQHSETQGSYSASATYPSGSERVFITAQDAEPFQRRSRAANQFAVRPGLLP